MIFCPENCLVKFVFSFHPQTVDGLILEKPTDKQDAYRMLSRCIFFFVVVLSEVFIARMQKLKYTEMIVFQIEW